MILITLHFIFFFSLFKVNLNLTDVAHNLKRRGHRVYSMPMGDANMVKSNIVITLMNMDDFFIN